MRKVRLQAVNEKYKDAILYVCPEWDAKKGAFITGQEDLDEDKLAKEPYVIDPDIGEPLNHNMTLMVCSEKGERRTKDDVLYGLFMQNSMIAKKVREVNKSQHLFVMIDQEVEAVDVISKADLQFDAMQKVRENMTLKKLRDIGIFLALPIKDQPFTVIQSRVYEACDTRPNDVLDFFSEKAQDELFVRKLLFYGLLQKKDQGRIYSREGVFVGGNIRDARDYVNNDKYADQVSLWSQRLIELDEPEMANMATKHGPKK